MKKSKPHEEVVSLVKDSFEAKVKRGKTLIYAYVFDKIVKKNNSFSIINCQNFMSLQASVYDNGSNTISLYCCECFCLGRINFVVKGKLKNSNLKEFYIPIPNKIVLSNLNEYFYDTYKCMKNKYFDTKKYSIKFFQMVEI